MSIHPAPAATDAVVTDDPPQYYRFIADVCEPLGERFALFGDDGARIEALRVRADFSSLPGFDAALEQGLRQLHAQPPASAVPVRLHARAASDLSITVLSNIPDGVRVSDCSAPDFVDSSHA